MQEIILKQEEIQLKDFDCFDAKEILECGQIFRFKKIADKDLGEGYICFSLDKYAKIFGSGKNWTIKTKDVNYFYNFFDLQRDYRSLCEQLSKKSSIMESACFYGRGIRILKQNAFETAISFIISSNNNIKRIQGIIERLCQSLGSKTEEGYAFPTLTQMLAADKDFFTQIGCGYRADYIYNALRTLADGFDLEGLKNMPTEQARKKLNELKGVGSKVADCILLFGLGKKDVFPVDTWIEKVYHSYFESGLLRREMADFFVELFGNNAGFAQQYLFYYQREGSFLK